MKRLFSYFGQATNLQPGIREMFYTYILYSPAIKKFYIGNTSNLEQRVYYHNNNRSSFTKNKGPWMLVYSEEYETRREALIRERELKSWKSSKRIITELNIELRQ
jgi:putative endonuclease